MWFVYFYSSCCGCRFGLLKHLIYKRFCPFRFIAFRILRDEPQQDRYCLNGHHFFSSLSEVHAAHATAQKCDSCPEPHDAVYGMAERVGFEPTHGLHRLVDFESTPLGLLGTSPCLAQAEFILPQGTGRCKMQSPPLKQQIKYSKIHSFRNLQVRRTAWNPRLPSPASTPRGAAPSSYISRISRAE